MYTKKAFSLVELIVVIVILAILWTISFIALQGYSIDARDTKRLSDVKSLLSKINVEQTMWIPLEELMDEDKKENKLTINWKSNIPWYQWVVNYNTILENSDSFKDPSNNQDYPFAYSYWTIEYDWKVQSYNFVQLAYVSERERVTKLVWNYFQFQDWTDSPSLFTHSWTTWENTSDYYIDDDIEQIYDIWEQAVVCKPQSVDWYSISVSKYHSDITMAEKQEEGIIYTQKFKCDNWTFKEEGTSEAIWCIDEGKILQWTQWSYVCVENNCNWTIPPNTEENATQLYGWTWTYSQTPWICTYKNKEWFHTEDGGTTFKPDTKPCDITDWTWNKTRNTSGNNWWECALISCDGGNHTEDEQTCISTSCSSLCKWYCFF
jgi:prepilin-type N-terminal cleavage/methylation domain-containing protein